MRRRSPWRGILLGLAILFCGAAIGTGTTSIVTKKITRKHILEAWRGSPRMSELMANRIERVLDLSPEQAEQVQGIVKERMGAVREIVEERRPLIDEQLKLMKDEVAGVLNEEQAEKWGERSGWLLRGPGPPRGCPSPQALATAVGASVAPVAFGSFGSLSPPQPESVSATTSMTITAQTVTLRFIVRPVIALPP